MKSSKFGLGVLLALVGLLSLILLTPIAAQAQVVKIKEITPPPAKAALAPEQGEGREILHQVREGEELHMLAAYYYGDARQWPKIYQANRDLIKNPNRITKGEILSIPVPQDWQPFMPYDEFFKRASAGGPAEAPAEEAPAPPAAEEKKPEGTKPEEKQAPGIKS